MEDQIKSPRLTAKQAQDYIPCSRATLQHLIKEPGFPVIRLGKKILIPREELDIWINKNLGKAK